MSAGQTITLCQRYAFLPPLPHSLVVFAFARVLSGLFLHGPLGGDSATPCRSRGWAPCRNKALLSTSRPKTRSGDAWCCWAFFSLLRFALSRFVALVSAALGLASLRPSRRVLVSSCCSVSFPRLLVSARSRLESLQVQQSVGWILMGLGGGGVRNEIILGDLQDEAR